MALLTQYLVHWPITSMARGFADIKDWFGLCLFSFKDRSPWDKGRINSWLPIVFCYAFQLASLNFLRWFSNACMIISTAVADMLPVNNKTRLVYVTHVIAQFVLNVLNQSAVCFITYLNCHCDSGALGSDDDWGSLFFSSFFYQIAFTCWLLIFTGCWSFLRAPSWRVKAAAIHIGAEINNASSLSAVLGR